MCQETALPATPDEFFVARHLGKWRSEAEVYARFPNLAENSPDTYRLLKKSNPNEQSFLIVVVGERTNGEPKIPLPGGGEYFLMAGYFGRYRPGMVYISDDHREATGELRLSKDIEGKQGGVSGITRRETIEICANTGSCPNNEARTKFVSDKFLNGVVASAQAASQVAKLRDCSRCRMAKYCSAACQKAHWATHKAICKQLAPSPAKSP
jgi:radical SAM protein with 4Fe4S-binding SPASM domain